jgi:hypothetical protein
MQARQASKRASELQQQQQTTTTTTNNNNSKQASKQSQPFFGPSADLRRTAKS